MVPRLGGVSGGLDVTPEEAARKFSQAAQELPERVLAAETRSLADLKAAALARSQGPLQPADLRRMGHPYSRRRGARLNPDIINRVSGRFAAGWDTDGPRFDGGGVEGALFNTSVEARGLEGGLVFGEPLMVPRGPHLAAYEDVREAREERLSEVWETLLR
jgi:hypothetical protein